MTIQTLDLGAEIWFLSGYVPVMGKVVGVNFMRGITPQGDGHENVSYLTLVDFDGEERTIQTEVCFDSKEELLDFIKG